MRHEQASRQKPELLATISSEHELHGNAVALTKKNAGNNAGIGILIEKPQPFFQRKNRHTRQSQVER